MMLRTASMGRVETLKSLAGIVTITTPRGEQHFQAIDDEQLVLLAGAPAVVVHIGDGAELVRLTGVH
jgi:hypothetical protein